MMAGRLVLLAVCLACVRPAWAQDISGKRDSLVYFNNLKSGVLLGGYSPSSDFTVSAANGVRWKRLSASVEVGLDRFSSWTVVPMGMGLSYDLFQKRNAFYIYCGTSKPVHFNRPGENRGPNTEYSASWSFNPAVGYRIKVDRASLYFQVGYKAQSLTTSYWYDSRNASRNSYSSTREFQRFQAMIGFGFR